MGSTSSKFRKALAVGDEKVAEELYYGSAEFQKSFDPNISYGENYHHNTAFHYASRHGMHRLVRIFLQRHGGNPNKRNSDNQTSLHCICMEEQLRPPSSTYSYSQYYYSQPPEKKRLECTRLVLAWRGITMGGGEREQIHLDAEDEDGCTALHYAAESGYLSLVEMLLENNASMFVENADKDTPCDCAEKRQHVDIAQLLESKMVFSPCKDEEESITEIGAMQYEETYTGLRLQDLQETKDLVVVETADMLRVPLFTAEALLRNYEWSRESLLEAWIQNPMECCESCGVKPPDNLDSFTIEHQLTSLEPKQVTPEEEAIMCDICTSVVPANEISTDTPCTHQFCRECWERYLSGKIKEGNSHNIVCPAYNCDKLVPVEAIEKLVSREMARKYLQFDINAFVESNPKLKWCPVASCGRAVRMPQPEPSSSNGVRRPSGSSSPSSPSSVSHAVDCGAGHTFCWDCGGDAHEPCSCDNWKKWLDKIGEIKPEELASTDNETELAANCLWLVTNSKPCPKCMAPIQKNDGCNHMKCTKCKHDFCWVCQEAWSKHSSDTGGYFRCNRFEVVTKVEEKSENLLTDAEKKHKDMQELNRFIHFYTRFKNHGHSHSLEEPLLRKAPLKMKKLAARSGPAGLEATRFIEESIEELLRARRILRFSYPYGYYLENRGGSKQIFEFMQNELEEATEILSQMVARHYLRTPRHKVVQAAQLVLRKRHEFLSAVSKGLLPPESPPCLARRSSNLHPSSWDSDSDEEDEALRQAIEASLQEAVAQAETASLGDQQEEPASLAALDSHLKSRGKRHSTEYRDPGNMTEGLLRALEMSQLLLLQQTEQLRPHDPRPHDLSGTASTKASVDVGGTASGNKGNQTGSTSVLQVTSAVNTQAIQCSSQSDENSGLPSSFDDDFRKAVQLSLRDFQSGTDTDVSQNDPKMQLRDPDDLRRKPNASSGSSKSRRKKHGAVEAKVHSRSGKSSGKKPAKTPVAMATFGGESDGLMAAGLLELSKELETEFDRIQRRTLSPDLDGDEEDSTVVQRENKTDKPRTIPATVLQCPGKASSRQRVADTSLLSAGLLPDGSQRPYKIGSAMPLFSDDVVRAVRASSDPYAPAIKSLLTHLESQRAVSAEHVSKTQLSQAATSSNRPADSSTTAPARKTGTRYSLDESRLREKYRKVPPKSTLTYVDKPVWLEGPLLAKSTHGRAVHDSTKAPAGGTFKKQASPHVSIKPSVNIELYMSRKATLKEEQVKRQELSIKMLPEAQHDQVELKSQATEIHNIAFPVDHASARSTLDLQPGGFSEQKIVTDEIFPPSLVENVSAGCEASESLKVEEEHMLSDDKHSLQMDTAREGTMTCDTEQKLITLSEDAQSVEAAVTLPPHGEAGSDDILSVRQKPDHEPATSSTNLGSPQEACLESHSEAHCEAYSEALSSMYECSTPVVGASTEGRPGGLGVSDELVDDKPVWERQTDVARVATSTASSSGNRKQSLASPEKRKIKAGSAAVQTGAVQTEPALTGTEGEISTEIEDNEKVWQMFI